jgi:hypothetical protein
VAIPHTAQTWADGNPSFPTSAARLAYIEAGIVGVSQAPAVRVTHNATQSATSATPLVLAFNTERYDQAAGVASTQHDTVTNNSRLTAVYAGVYSICTNGEWAASVAAAAGSTIQIRLNGATVIARQFIGNIDFRSWSVETEYSMAVNDYVEVVARVHDGPGRLMPSRGVINLTNYTTGNGVADDTAGVTQAITDTATSGGVLLVPDGSYLLTSAIALPRATQKGLRIIGTSQESAKFVFTGVGHAFTFGGTSNADAAYGQWLEDLTIQCTYTGNAILGAAKFQAATWCGLRRVRINGSNLGNQFHVDFAGGAYFSFYNTINGCDFRGIDQPTDTGVRLLSTTADGANANWVTGNFFSTYNRAVLVASGDENWIKENHFGSAVNTAVRLDSSGTGNANDNTVTLNQFDGPTTAVDVASGAVETYVFDNIGATSAYINNGTNTRERNNLNAAWTGSGSFARYQTVASAASLTLPVDAEVVSVTGTNNVTSMTIQPAGRRVTLIFAGILTFTSGNNLKLNTASGNFVTTANDQITLVSDGTNWIEVSRSDNQP